jgi:hypothetical protein
MFLLYAPIFAVLCACVLVLFGWLGFKLGEGFSAAPSMAVISALACIFILIYSYQHCPECAKDGEIVGWIAGTTLISAMPTGLTIGFFLTWCSNRTAQEGSEELLPQK